MNENCMTLSENWVKMSNRAHKATVSAPNGKSCEESDHRARVMWRRRIGNELAKRIMAHKANGGGGLVKEANLRFKPTAPSAKNSCGISGWGGWGIRVWGTEWTGLYEAYPMLTCSMLKLHGAYSMFRITGLHGTYCSMLNMLKLLNVWHT